MDEAVDCVARQLKVPAADLGFYEWSGRTIEYHRSQIRGHFGFRECSVADADKLTDWLAVNVAHAERNADRVRDELICRCRAERIEPPAGARVTRIVRSALHNAEETWFAVIASRIGAAVTSRVIALVDAGVGDDDQESRFTRSATHPAYQAMLEIGRAQRTIFAARYLRDRDLQREIEEGINVVEAWNGANAIICYGRGGEIASNRQKEVEMTALCLRILQAALVYVNTLMLQDVLAETEWASLLAPADRRGLTPLFWQHARPYGEVRLNMTSRLRIGAGADMLAAAAPRGREKPEETRTWCVKRLAAGGLITVTAVVTGGDCGNLKERAVGDPVLIAVVISCTHAASRVIDALAQRIVLRARRDLVQATAALVPGTEVSEQNLKGTWQVRVRLPLKSGRK